MKKKDLEQITDFIYEVGNLRKTPRSGFWFLGTGTQSVAEHLFRTAYIAYAIAYLTPKANKDKVVLMALTHDLAEGRTSDLNYVHQRYGRLAEARAFDDITEAVPFGGALRDLYVEEQAKKTLEARIVKDADRIEWIASLREEEVKGNKKAKEWIGRARQRIDTSAAKKIVSLIIKTHPDHWWFDKNNKWFVAREEKYRSMRRGKK
ncbi:MAG: HD domain-containing protein [Patescibacteria group bacterium]